MELILIINKKVKALKLKIRDRGDKLRNILIFRKYTHKLLINS